MKRNRERSSLCGGNEKATGFRWKIALSFTLHLNNVISISKSNVNYLSTFIGCQCHCNDADDK
jgi:hypothetical protein